MNELLTAAQMRAIEEAAIARGEVTGLELMERAGAGVVAAVLEQWPELAEGGHRAVVLCGPGNNGGDGFVVARLLKARGWEVEVFLFGDPLKMPPDARVNDARWRAMGQVHGLAMPEPSGIEIGAVAAAVGHAGTKLVVDALFGTGLTRPIHGLSALLKETGLGDGTRGQGGPYIVALDLPSGVCSDSGRILGHADQAAVRARLTVAFHAPKRGHFLAAGAVRSGTLRVVDIGLTVPVDREAAFRAGQNMDCVALVQGAGFLPALRKAQGGHKYASGHALVLSGPSGRGGAARLAARGALRIGAGLVTVGCPPDAVVENAARLDAVMLRPVADAGALQDALGDARINALCLGPALGTGPREAGLLAAALAAGRALALDADALTLLAREGALFSALHGDCVLTPHAGEFARLFPDLAAKLETGATKGPAYSKVDAAREAAARAGCVVLFKGPDTVIAGPDGRCAINSAHYDRAAPWLATAGAGDVLAGFITGLLARGFAPFDAACAGAWLHVDCALDFGPGLIAEDLPEVLPRVLRGLGV